MTGLVKRRVIRKLTTLSPEREYGPRVKHVLPEGKGAMRDRELLVEPRVIES